MKELVLNYYNQFKCIAGECKHTCCAGWEMQIDEQSLSFYKENDSQFSKRLKSGINFKKSKFKTDSKKRCAFLNEKGLCDIIINLGEQSLCQVCRDHPRFRTFFSDRVETGLGFSCEKATRIILTFNEKIAPVQVFCDQIDRELNFNEKNILEFRQQALEVVQDRKADVNERLQRLLTISKASFCDADFNKVVKKFLSFERIDKGWAKRLKAIKNTAKKATEQNLSHYAEQFLANSLYRHLYDAEDTMWVRARTIACVFSWFIINSIIENEKDGSENLLELSIDLIRQFSCEVEYSQNNLDALFDFAYRFIKL